MITRGGMFLKGRVRLKYLKTDEKLSKEKRKLQDLEKMRNSSQISKYAVELKTNRSIFLRKNEKNKEKSIEKSKRHIYKLERKKEHYYNSIDKEKEEFFKTLGERINRTDDFYLTLCKYIEKKGIKKDAELYRASGVSKQVFSNISKGTIPTVSNVVRLALGLHCTLREANALLKSAGYALCNNNAYDLAVKFFFKHKIYCDFEKAEQIQYKEYFDYIESESQYTTHKNRYTDWFKE